MLVSDAHSDHQLTAIVDLVFCSDKSLEFDSVRVGSLGDPLAQRQHYKNYESGKR